MTMEKKLTIEEKYGYHIIATEEDRKRFEPKLPTDEYLKIITHKWSLVSEPSTDFIEINVYRRRISIPDGWELVPLDGTVQQGDRAFFGDGYTEVVFPLGKTILDIYENGFKAVFRRKQPAAVTDIPPDWIPVAERLPEPRQPFWVSDLKRMDYCSRGKNEPSKFLNQDEFWLSATGSYSIPPLPLPVAKQCYDAYTTAHPETVSYSIIKPVIEFVLTWMEDRKI